MTYLCEFDWNYLLQVLDLIVKVAIGAAAVFISFLQFKISKQQSNTATHQAHTAMRQSGTALQQLALVKEQTHIAETKISLDLFTRRLDVFDNIWEAISKVYQSGSAQESVSNCNKADIILGNSQHDIHFLFGGAPAELISKVRTKIQSLRTINMATVQNGNVMPEKYNQENTNLENWLKDVIDKELQATFSHFMDFSKWRS